MRYNFMNNIDPDSKKTLLLRLYILFICLSSIGLFTLVYLKLSPSQNQSLNDYELNMHKFLKEYNEQEQLFLKYSFFENYDMLVFQNAKLNQNYKNSINDFTNLTQKEFYSLYELVRKIASTKNFGEINRFGYNYSDWSTKETVIRDEKGFNTSFIFSALTSIEYRINKKNKGNWITLSAQEVIDCCPECMNSKRPQTVFDYIKKNGVYEEEVYSYENSRFDTVPKKCRREEKSGKKYFIEGYESVRNCQALEKQIGNGPLVVGLDGRNFPSYEYSIFTDCQRKTTHYATIVGMSFDHWKLQNSWGRKWGERGFIRIGPGDTCGVCLRGSAPIVKQQ